MAGKDALPPERIDEALAGLPDWRAGNGGLVTVFKMPTAAAALTVIADVGRLAEEQNHHPDLDWRYNRIFIRYTSHDAGGQVTARDLAAAAGASAAAAAAGAVAEPAKYVQGH
ncbi:4a-hydroxytetrahydrobiopterin dehydratase [Pseudarthrobacter quantipunctorum]|uniref:Putative pterin-4-alpha-carbinolamine dehydratase n=1 Tax=Pseudarthrobacter quantipunctorum TaxID=3128980 RepID=A0ABZ2RDZ5_9MICC